MFSDFIKNYREKFGYTQTELVSKIQTINESFEALDEITLSRWENGHTKPSMKKQVLLLIHLGLLKNFIHMYNEESMATGKLDSLLLKRYRNNFSGSDSPYCCCEKEPITVKEYDGVPSFRFKFYIEYFNDVHKINVENLDTNVVINLISKMKLIEFYSSSGQIVGHFLYMIIDSEFISLNLRKKIATDYDFGDEGSIYIVSCYAATKKVFMYHIKILLDIIIHNNTFPKNVFVKCFFSEMMAFYESLGGNLVIKGPMSDFGMKINLKIYQWVLYKIDVVELLSSKVLYIDESVISDGFIIE
ncbi:helix-turn-helix domain-containing protein [Shewanella mangrovisoli]|uniref:helix-turn-helix domain-containing protein n=1 Tax=Shewanella mangrovisoli TaxID=2864211 RepID=UPI0035B8969C